MLVAKWSVTKWNAGLLGLSFLASGLAHGFELSAQDRSCGMVGPDGRYLKNEVEGEIARKAFDACPNQAVRRLGEIHFDIQRTADGNCEAFDEIVTGTGEFECVPTSPTSGR